MMLTVRFLLQWNLKYADQVETSAAVGLEGWQVVVRDVARTQPLAVVSEPLFQIFFFSLVFFGFRIFDGIADPIAGIVGDRWVAKGRERRKLLLYALAFPAIGITMAFASGFGMPEPLRWAILITGLTLYFVGYTFYAIPYWSLVEDYGAASAEERRVLSNLLGAGTLLATALVSLVTPPLVVGLGYSWSAVIVGIVGLGLMVLPYFARPEGQTAPEATLDPDADSLSVFSSMRDLLRRTRQALKHRRFAAFLALFCGSQMAFTVISLGSPFIAQRLLFRDETAVALLMAPFLITALPTFFFAPAISKRFGWQRSVTVASVVLAVVYAGTASFGISLVHSPMTTAMIVFGCGGPCAAVILGLEGEAITDCAREAGGEVVSLYWGVFNFVVKSLNGVALMITGLFVKLSYTEGMGRIAIRAMGITAGGLLILGVWAYYVLRPKAADGEHSQSLS
ncbi:MAG: MFS transporter [Planctomycetota bacterium]|jgi:Na+/melibiose symporter-like transporter